MFTKRRFIWATTIVVAALAAACSGAEDSAGLSLTAPSANSGLAAAGDLTSAQAAALSATCGAFGSGDKVTNGTPPPGGAPRDAITGPPGGLGPGDRVTNGVPPPGPTPGSQLAIGGSVEGLAGSCPVVTFMIGGKTVRTNATTSFGGGSCALLKNSERVGAMGATLADGSIAASCVASGI